MGDRPARPRVCRDGRGRGGPFGTAVRRHRSVARAAGPVGPARLGRRAPLVRPPLRRGVCRRGAGGQTPGGVLRALGLGRYRCARVGDGRGPPGGPPGHRRRQAGGHRVDHGGLRLGLAGSGQPAGGRRGHPRSLPRDRRAATGPRPGRRPRAGAPSWSCAAPTPRAGPSRRRPRPRSGGTPAGPSVEDALLEAIGDLNRGGLAVPGTVGAVVGATLQPSQFDLAGLGGVILAPGLGAQGGTVEGAARLFAGCPPHSVLANVSRSLLAAGPDVGRSGRRPARPRGTGRLG